MSRPAVLMKYKEYFGRTRRDENWEQLFIAKKHCTRTPSRAARFILMKQLLAQTSAWKLYIQDTRQGKGRM